MPISVQVSDLGGWGLPDRLLEAGIAEAFATESISQGEISLTFMGDEGIRALNRQYLERDRPTDVIAFALHGPGESVLGDVYVGYEQVLRQAGELGVGLEEELLRVSIHGALHVLGHDHPEGPERSESPMFLKQEAILMEVLSRMSAGESP